MTTTSQPVTQPVKTITPRTRLVLTPSGTLRIEHPEHYRGEDLFYPTQALPSNEDSSEDMKTFLNLWWDTWQSQPVTLKVLLRVTQEKGLFAVRRANGNHRSQIIRMGIFLHRQKGLLIHGFRMISIANPYHKKSETRFALIQDNPNPPNSEGA